MWTWQVWTAISAALIIGACLGMAAMAILNAAGDDRGFYGEESDLLRDELQALTDMLETERLQASIIRELLQVEPTLHQTLFECTLDRIRSLLTSAILRSKRIAGDTVLAWLINDHDTTWSTVKPTERDSAIANGAQVIDLVPAKTVCCNQTCSQGRDCHLRDPVIPQPHPVRKDS